MNKKLLIILPIAVVLIIIVMLLIPKDKTSTMIVSIADYNFKSGATFGGIAIYNDGTVYTWYYSSSKSNYNSDLGQYSIKTKEGLTKYFTSKGTKKDYTVSGKDLRQIKRYINELSKQDNSCITDTTTYTEITLYMNDKTIVIPASENCNTNPNILKLASLIKEYNKKDTKKTN